MELTASQLIDIQKKQLGSKYPHITIESHQRLTKEQVFEFIFLTDRLSADQGFTNNKTTIPFYKTLSGLYELKQSLQSKCNHDILNANPYERIVINQFIHDALGIIDFEELSFSNITAAYAFDYCVNANPINGDIRGGITTGKWASFSSLVNDITKLGQFSFLDATIRIWDAPSNKTEESDFQHLVTLRLKNGLVSINNDIDQKDIHPYPVKKIYNQKFISREMGMCNQTFRDYCSFVKKRIEKIDINTLAEKVSNFMDERK